MSGSSSRSPTSAERAYGVIPNSVPPIRCRQRPQLRGDVLVAGDGGARHGPEPLVERDVDAVEERGDLREASWPRKGCDSQSRAPSTWNGTPSSRVASENAEAPPRSAAGSRPRAAAAPAGRRPSCRAAGSWRAGRRRSRSPSPRSGSRTGTPAAAAARRSRGGAGGPGRGSPPADERRRSHQTRSAACWAMVPLTKNTSGRLPEQLRDVRSRAVRPHPGRRSGPTPRCPGRRGTAPRPPRPGASSSPPAPAARARPQCRRTPGPRPGTVPAARSHRGRYAADNAATKATLVIKLTSRPAPDPRGPADRARRPRRRTPSPAPPGR